jgi:hypothetical protein
MTPAALIQRRCITISALLLKWMLQMKNAATLAALLSALSFSLATETQKKPTQVVITRKAA